jgi:hypothetical protein
MAHDIVYFGSDTESCFISFGKDDEGNPPGLDYMEDSDDDNDGD